MTSPAPDYQVSPTTDEVRAICSQLLAERMPVGIDIETGYDGEFRPDAQKHPEEGFIVSIQITNSNHWARFWPLRFDAGTNLDNFEVAEALWPVAQSGLMTAWNSSFEARFLSRWFKKYLADHPAYGAQVRAGHHGNPEFCGYFPWLSDPMLELHATGRYRSLKLKEATKLDFGKEMTEIGVLFALARGGKDLTVKEMKGIRFNTLNLEGEHRAAIVEYGCDDSVYELCHHHRRYPQVKDSLIYQLEMSIQPIACQMMDEGILLDWPLMREGAVKARLFQDRMQEEIQEDLTALLAAKGIDEPCRINLRSSQQLVKVLYEQLEMPIHRRTPRRRNKKGEMTGGTPSTEADTALQPLIGDYPVVQRIIDYKALDKLAGTYLEKYELDYSYCPCGRTHPNWMQAGVPAGRWACSQWPVQQSPKYYLYKLHRSQEQFEHSFRDNVKAPDGWYILGYDYAQIERRVFAGEAQDPALLEAFRSGVDIHKRTAADLFGIPIDQVTKEQRAKGKAQPVDEPVLTPEGWRRIGSLRPGDYVIGSRGLPVEVTGVFPQGEKPVYQVTTSDGAQTRCCEDHLWTVRNRNTHGDIWRTKPLKDLIAAGLGRGVGSKYELPSRPVVRFALSDQLLPLNPYVLGLLLGDGNFTQEVQFCSADQELLDAVKAEHERFGGRVTQPAERKPGLWYIWLRAEQPFARDKNHVKTALKQLGLMGLKGEDKFIPPEYLTATPEDRLALLQGLLDTDGNVLKSGAEFGVCSEQLARGVVEIAHSLGGRASIKQHLRPRTRKHLYGEPKPRWRVYLRLPVGMEPFRLARKLKDWKVPQWECKQFIRRIEPAGQEPCVCISVDSDDGLYIAQDYIVTHNTTGFGMDYGLGEEGLADRLGVPLAEAQSLRDAYFRAYNRLKPWTARTVEQAKRDGYVLTGGFRRKVTVWEFESTDRRIYSEGERLAGNAPIQGGAADYMKVAMVRAIAALKAAGLDDRVRLIMNMHDALEFYVRKDVRPLDVIRVLQPAVVWTAPFIAHWPPMVAEWHMGLRWGSVKEAEITLDGSGIPVGLRIKEDKKPEPQQEVSGNGPASAAMVPAQQPAVAAGRPGEEHLHHGAAPGPAGGGVHDSHPGSSVVITVAAMPQVQDVRALIEMLGTRPGGDTVVLRTPEGALEIARNTSLAPYQHPEVTLVLRLPVTVSLAMLQAV